jgi:hypothetical protein
MNTMTPTNQLELGFRSQATPNHRRVCPPPGRLRAARAQWWFAKMRAAVANATNWPEPPRPDSAFRTSRP